ncbi:hypothetical protein CBOM_00823 [Ceraceosorus bombacis]|uniref:Myb-like domain-containing protein n=1 Tax=Ceraceosorus bombacis TaxID=401625 RepID=A0A0P1BAY3_9BASI|nr:hypothetical protein CBOM_00823 [Ceraceosorus bombacis]
MPTAMKRKSPSPSAAYSETSSTSLQGDDAPGSPIRSPGSAKRVKQNKSGMPSEANAKTAWTAAEDKVFIDMMLASYKPDFPVVAKQLGEIRTSQGLPPRALKQVYARNERIKVMVRKMFEGSR